VKEDIVIFVKLAAQDIIHCCQGNQDISAQPQSVVAQPQNHQHSHWLPSIPSTPTHSLPFYYIRIKYYTAPKVLPNQSISTATSPVHPFHSWSSSVDQKHQSPLHSSRPPPFLKLPSIPQVKWRYPKTVEKLGVGLKDYCTLKHTEESHTLSLSELNRSSARKNRNPTTTCGVGCPVQQTDTQPAC